MGRVEAFAQGYQGSHTPPAPSYGAPMHDLGRLLPDDVYDRRVQRQYFGTGDERSDAQSFAAINRARGNPEVEVTVHRAVPAGVTSINPGDWVTPSAHYAHSHARSQFADGKVLSRTVPARELWTSGDSINEFGWHPQ